MKLSSKFVLLAAVAMGAIAMNVYAADVPASPDQAAANDESVVVGACMTVSIQNKVPGLAPGQIKKCSAGNPKDLPKCLGVTDADFMTFINACKSQLNNAKCVAGKLNVKLIQYADCGYEKDPEACYKSLGTSSDAVVKLSQQCAAEGVK